MPSDSHLMDSSHFSRVCGHGHIKKFWLMQTQQENKVCQIGSMNDNNGNGVGMKSPHSPSDLSSQHSEQPAAIWQRRRIFQGYSESLVNIETKDSCVPLSSEEEDHDEEGDLGTVENTINSLQCFVSKKKLKKKNNEEEEESFIATELRRYGGISSNISSSSSSSCDSDSSSRSCYFYNRGSKENRNRMLTMRDRLDEEEEGEKGAIHSVKYHDAHDQHDFLTTPNRRGNGAPYSSPATSLMEVVCGEETKNSVDEKQQTIHACKEFNNDNQGLATQASEPDEARMVTDNQPSKINLVPESLKPVKAPEVTRASDAASIQESRDRRPLAEKFAHHNSSLKECALCGATKTPMWRSGPQGPKSLCNACGIRYKKYRSYPDQSDIMSDPMMQPKPSSELNLKQQRKRKWHHHLGSTPLKKVYGYPFPSRLKRLSTIDIEHRRVRRVFAEDEEEAAVLLMHLSCGLVY